MPAAAPQFDRGKKPLVLRIQEWPIAGRRAMIGAHGMV
ncbi:hypothetical protein BF49_4072 [Bradyrhizobium sp.]|nr:hypothetical protein BF49_4072 [Bradyrhizobium sp.]